MKSAKTSSVAPIELRHHQKISDATSSIFIIVYKILVSQEYYLKKEVAMSKVQLFHRLLAIILLFILCLVLEPLFVLSQDVEKKPDTQDKKQEEKPPRGKELIVTASPLNPKDIFDTPYSADIITGEDIQKYKLSRTIPDAIKEVPGISVQKTSNGHGSPFIRGFTGFRNVLLIDGIRLNNSTFREGPNQYWNTVDEFLVDRLEIVKGPSSVLYGSDSIGGTVVAYTKEPNFAKEFSYGAKTFGRYASAENSYTGRQEFLLGDTNIASSIGFTYRDFNDIVAGQTSGELPNTGYDEYDADAKVAYLLGEGKKLILAFQRNRQDDVPRTHRTIYSKEFNGTTIGTDKRADYDQERELYYIQYKWEKAGLFFDRMEASLSWHRQAETFNRLTSSNKKEWREFEVNTPGFWFRLGSPTEIGYLTYGAEYYRDLVISDGFDKTSGGVVTDFTRGEVPDNSKYDLLGAYIQDEFTPIKNLDVTMGMRYNYAKLDADEVDPSGFGAPPLNSFDETYRAFVGSGKLVYHLNENWNLIGGVSQGFRAPTFDDATAVRLVMSGQTDYPSPDLKPEKSINYEIGVRAKYPKWEAQSFFFWTELEDLIRRIPAPDISPTAFRKDNFAEGFVKGLELQGRYYIQEDWSVFGDFAWTIGKADALVGGEKVERPLAKINPAMAHIGLRFQPVKEKYWVEGLTTIARKQTRLAPEENGEIANDWQRIPPNGTPGYTIFTLRGGLELCKNATATISIENISDKDYRIHGSGQNEPGTNFILGLDMKF